MKFLKNKNRGFTLLFAVLIASVLLSVALAIFSQMYKTLLLSSASKESLAAFYAADSGAECALFWDLKHSGFDKSIFPNPDNPSGVVNTAIKCNDKDFTGSWVPGGNNPRTTSFDLSFADTGGCTKVKVSKEKNLVSGEISTTIESHGYNICGSSPRKVERAVRVTY